MSYGQKWRPPPSWILKISIFGHVTVIGFNIWCSVPNFIKIGWFLTEIWRFNDFQNGGRPPSWISKISSFCHSPRRHTVLLPHTKFRWNRTIGRWVIAKKNQFSRWRSPPSWIVKILIFGHVTVIGFNIWCSVPNFIKIGRFLTDIWRFNDFKNSGRPPSWILKICSFCHVALVDIPFCFLIQNFAVIGQSVDELWPKNRFSRCRPPPSWILKISIFGHVTVIGFNIWCSVPNFIKIGWFLTEIWWFSDLQNGGRPPSWICCDVTILHRRTHFHCPNIVLKFHVDRCCSFRDTCSMISRPFGCTKRTMAILGCACAVSRDP